MRRRRRRRLICCCKVRPCSCAAGRPSTDESDVAQAAGGPGVLVVEPAQPSAGGGSDGISAAQFPRLCWWRERERVLCIVGARRPSLPSLAFVRDEQGDVLLLLCHIYLAVEDYAAPGVRFLRHARAVSRRPKIPTTATPDPLLLFLQTPTHRYGNWYTTPPK